MKKEVSWIKLETVITSYTLSKNIILINLTSFKHEKTYAYK